MSKTPLPAVLGGNPVIGPADDPVWPVRGQWEQGALGDVVQDGPWYSFAGRSGPQREALEQTVAALTGDRYGVGTTSGTEGIAAGLRVQLMMREPAWAAGRDRVLVANYTHAAAHDGVLAGVARQLGRTPTLVPIDACPDGTMDPSAVADYLERYGQRVLGIVPATMYGNFGAVGEIAALGEKHGVIVHHDNALGGAARYDGRHALTSSISGQGDGKAAPSAEAGMVLTSDARVAAYLRADSDCGSGPTRLDPIPHLELAPIPAGNRRLSEPAAALWGVQWQRALHARLVARENRRRVDELLSDPSLFPHPVLWTPRLDAEHPPFFCWYALVDRDVLWDQLGLTPKDVRVALAAEGLWAERGFAPTHRDPAWAWCARGQMDYPVSDRIYSDAVFIHTKFLRHPRFPDWMASVFHRLVDHADALRGIGARYPEPTW